MGNDSSLTKKKFLSNVKETNPTDLEIYHMQNCFNKTISQNSRMKINNPNKTLR